MPRESTITVLRSTTTDVPTGLTFGEIAYSDLNGKFHIGKSDGTSLWIGAQITAGDITTNSQYIIPTQSAVKSYVDGAIGGGAGVVNTVNATGGAITITGDGGALFNTQVAKANTVGVRLATTGVTGVASFNSSYFSVSSGAVSLASAYQATGDTVVGSANIGVTRVGNSVTVTNAGIREFNGLTGTITLAGDSGSVSLVSGVGVGDNYSYKITNRVASTSLTGVASFDPNTFSVSGTGHVAISTSNAIPLAFRDSFGNSLSAKWGSTVTLTGGSGVEVQNTASGVLSFRGITASTSTIGVASFNSSYFSVSSGAVSLASAYQATGDTVITTAGSGIAISASGRTDTLFNIGVTGFNGLTGNITVTGDGGSQIGADNNRFTNRLATTGVTGVASFNSSYFSVASGAVSLASAYQATGDTVQAGSGIAISANKTISNIGVTTFNGLTGGITVTGDSGSLVGRDNNKFTNRLADTSVTGVASFNSSYFSVASGAVSLAAAYQATGDTVITTAGSGIAISTSGKTDTLFNIGVTGLNGLTGNITLTGDGGAQIGADNNKFTNRLATTGVTGVASFNSSYFSVSSGAVSLAAAYQATGDSVQAGSGIAISANKTITNIGVTTFNGLTGGITVTGDSGSLVGRDNNKFTNRLADASVTGVASFNSSYFSVSSGAVSLAAAYQATGDTVITTAGSGIAISTSGKTDTLFNIGVTGFNGLTGNITVTGDGGSLVGVGNTNFTNRLATTGVTGVASFNSTHFSVSSGAVSSTGITVKASSADAGTTLNLGGTLTITGTVNQVSVSRSNTDFTIGLPNDITIPGNLTVNGTVVTANVDSFVVEDPLIMLGTGNAADSVDLGFYGQYTSSGKRFAGIYRDASDSGKFKFFTGLSGGVEPSTFVNDSGSGYTVATIVAKIDGGTF